MRQARKLRRGALAQLVRAPALQVGGRRFESDMLHHVASNSGRGDSLDLMIMYIAHTTTSAPIYFAVGLLVFGLILIAVGLYYRRRFAQKDKAKSNRTTAN